MNTHALSAVLLASALVAGFAHAAPVAVGPSATGDGSGTDWSNQAAWSSLRLERGNEYYLADGNYGGKTFSTAEASSTYIKICKATPSTADRCSTPHGPESGWANTLGDGQATFTGSVAFSTSYWIFDGARGSAWSKQPGDYGFAFTTMAQPISVFGRISDLWMGHIAARGTSLDEERTFLTTQGSAYSVQRVTVSHCLIDGFNNGEMSTSPENRNLDGWVWEHNVCLNLKSTSNHHGEWVNNNYGAMTNRVVRYNLFEGGGEGASGVVVANNYPTNGDQIYGNVVKDMELSNCIFGSASQGMGMNNARIYNNTIINTTTAGGVSGPYPHSGTVFYNNLFCDMSADLGSGGWAHDYNAYFNTQNAPAEANRQTGSTCPLVSLSAGDLRLAMATAPGMVLPQPQYSDVDPLGVLRGASDGVWDRGAFEFGGSPSTPDAGQPPPAFEPEACVQAELGEVAAPVALGSDPEATAGTYVATPNVADTGNGSVRFRFRVASAGTYLLQARVKAASLTSNSFFVGLDAEAAMGDQTMAFDVLPVTTTYVWDNVSRRGATGTSERDALDPMEWTLGAGEHTFTFYGREADARLDEVALRRCPVLGCAAVSRLPCQHGFSGPAAPRNLRLSP